MTPAAAPSALDMARQVHRRASPTNWVLITAIFGCAAFWWGVAVLIAVLF